MAQAQAAYDGLIREIYLASRRGPLRVALGEGSYPPYLESGDVVLVSRAGLDGVRPGEFIGVHGEHGDVRLLRFLRRENEHAQVFGPARVEVVTTEAVIGRASEIERAGVRVSLDAAQSELRLALEQALSRMRGGRRRFALQTNLSALYWHLLDSFVDGVSETGDILVTDRCPVGCRFCIYSCVAAGNDMTPELAGRSAREFKRAGIPEIRILGGEPFMSIPHLLGCFRAIRESYDADDIIILTSAYFGTSRERVFGKIEPLVAEGLKRLHLSFDAFHLERYPVDCYERVLDYCRERELEASLVVHYSVGLAPALDQLLALRQRYPFGVRITTVSREGDAAVLSEAETSVSGFGEFRRRLLAEPGIELIAEDRSCFRWTVFPNGDTHFCCKQNDENRVGNLNHEALAEVQERLRGHDLPNRLNVLRFGTGHTGEVSGNACLSCPLRAPQASESSN